MTRTERYRTLNHTMKNIPFSLPSRSFLFLQVANPSVVFLLLTCYPLLNRKSAPLRPRDLPELSDWNLPTVFCALCVDLSGGFLLGAKDPSPLFPMTVALQSCLLKRVYLTTKGVGMKKIVTYLQTGSI